MKKVIEKIVNSLVVLGIIAGAGWFIYLGQPKVIEVEKDGVIINYKDKLVVMINGDYRKITDTDLYVYATDKVNTKIRVNFDMEEDSEIITDINGWYDNEGHYHKLDNNEEE